MPTPKIWLLGLAYLVLAPFAVLWCLNTLTSGTTPITLGNWIVAALMVAVLRVPAPLPRHPARM